MVLLLKDVRDVAANEKLVASVEALDLAIATLKFEMSPPRAEHRSTEPTVVHRKARH